MSSGLNNILKNIQLFPYKKSFKIKIKQRITTVGVKMGEVVADSIAKELIAY